MKKLVILVIALIVLNFFIINLNFARSSDTIPGLPSALQPGMAEQYDPNKIADKGVQKWEYLQKEWKNILLNVSVIKAFDEMLTYSNNFYISRVLVGEPYYLDARYLAIVFLWLWFGLLFAQGIRLLGISDGASYLLGFLLITILAQPYTPTSHGGLRVMVDFLGNLMLARTLWWARLIIFGGICTVIGAVSYGSFLLANFKKEEELKKATEMAKKEQTLNQRLRELEDTTNYLIKDNDSGEKGFIGGDGI